MILVYGPPGSGKSTLAKILGEVALDLERYSVRVGEHKWDQTKYAEAIEKHPDAKIIFAAALDWNYDPNAFRVLLLPPFNVCTARIKQRGYYGDNPYFRITYEYWASKRSEADLVLHNISQNQTLNKLKEIIRGDET